MANLSKEKWFKVFDYINEYSLYWLVFFIPISSAGIESFFGFLFLSFIIKKSLKPDFNFLKSSSIVFLLFFFIFISASLVNSGTYLAKSFSALFFKWLEYITIFIVAQDTLSNRLRVRNVILVLLLASAIVGTSGITQRFFGFEFLRHRPMVEIDGGMCGITGPFKHYNEFGSYLVAVGMVITGVLFTKVKIATKIILLGLQVLILTCLFLTLSRGSFLGLIVALILMLILSRKFKILLLLVVLFTVALIFLPHTKERLLSTFQMGGDAERFEVWKGTWVMIKESHFLGKGLGTFMDHFSKYIPNLSVRYAHNFCLQMWAETGIFSLLSFLVFLSLVLVKAIKKFQENKDFILLGIICAVLGLLIHSFFDNDLYSLQLAVLFWFTLALLLAKAKIVDKSA